MNALGVTDHRFLGGPAGSATRDDGRAGQRSPPRLLEHRPRRGRRHSSRYPRGPAAGPRHLRPERRLRAPRPHPGAPRRDGGRRGGSRPARTAPSSCQAWSVAKVYWCCYPRSVLQQGIDAMAAAGDDTFFEGVTSAEEIPFGVPDDVVTAAVDGTGFVTHKDAAMRAHPTQILVDGPFFALSNNLGQEVLVLEYYRLVKGEAGPGRQQPGGLGGRPVRRSETGWPAAVQGGGLGARRGAGRGLARGRGGLLAAVPSSSSSWCRSGSRPPSSATWCCSTRRAGPSGSGWSRCCRPGLAGVVSRRWTAVPRATSSSPAAGARTVNLLFLLLGVTAAAVGVGRALGGLAAASGRRCGGARPSGPAGSGSGGAR